MRESRIGDFVERDLSRQPPVVRLRPPLELDANLSMAASTANVEAMGVNYFDKDGTLSKLGHGRNSGYADFYGVWPVSVAAQ